MGRDRRRDCETQAVSDVAEDLYRERALRGRVEGETDCDRSGCLFIGGVCLRCGGPERGVARTGPLTPIVPLLHGRERAA